MGALAQTIFLKTFVYQTALENKDNVSLQSHRNPRPLSCIKDMVSLNTQFLSCNVTYCTNRDHLTVFILL